MEFGSLKNVDGIKFSLPPDHPITSTVLSASRSADFKVYVGCPVWADSKMVGSLYPKGTKAKDFLALYSRQFNSIELNASGYGMPEDAEIKEWIKSTPQGFLFCPKVPQQIARTRPLGKNEQAVQDCYRSLKLFGKKLGPVFLQLHPTFKPDRFDDLNRFIDQWPKKIPLFVELRHEAWFSGSQAGDDLWRYLKKKKVGTVILDVTGRRDVCHMALTTPDAFIRFDGHDLHESDFIRLDMWVERIVGWRDLGLRSLYFFVHTPQKHLNPYLAKYFIDRLNARAGLGIPPPKLLKQYAGGIAE